MTKKEYKKGDVLSIRTHTYKGYKIKEEDIVLTSGYDNAGRLFIQYGIRFSVKIGNRWQRVGDREINGIDNMNLSDVKRLIDLRISRK